MPIAATSAGRGVARPRAPRRSPRACAARSRARRARPSPARGWICACSRWSSAAIRPSASNRISARAGRPLIDRRDVAGHRLTLRSRAALAYGGCGALCGRAPHAVGAVDACRLNAGRRGWRDRRHGVGQTLRFAVSRAPRVARSRAPRWASRSARPAAQASCIASAAVAAAAPAPTCTVPRAGRWRSASTTGPRPTPRQFVRMLERNHAPATFFMIGEHVSASYRSMLLRELRAATCSATTPSRTPIS